MKKKHMKKRESLLVTCVFYTVYFLMLIGYFFGMYFFQGWLTDELAHYEASAQPAFRAGEIFQTLFAEPNWEELYETAEIADTRFEGKAAFLTYITAAAGDQTLTFAEIAGQEETHAFEILAAGQPIGAFTLADLADAGARIPDWQLGTLTFYLPRTQSVTVEKTDNHTVYVNGRPLEDSDTIEILSISAEEFLPAGTQGIRRVRQRVTDLLVAPEITILDENGNSLELRYQEDTGIYTEVPAETATIPKELKSRALAAVEAYCTYMVEQSNAQLLKYFASGTDTFWEVTSADPWPQGALETTFIRQSVSEYSRYADDLFSARVRTTLVLSFEDLRTEQHSVDATFFFENRQDGWKVIAMTNADIRNETRMVRLTYMSGETLLSTNFFDSRSTELYAPQITPPPGQILVGWAEKTAAEDGSTGLKLVFTPNEKGKITVPQDMELNPMTLYPLFEDAPAVG